MTHAPQPGTVKRALSAHAAIGLLAGALLYLVSLTGTLAVFHAEWQRIEQPDAPETAAIHPAAVQHAVETVLNSGEASTSHLYVHLPVEDLPRTTITTDHRAVHVNADGSLGLPERIGWSDFLIDLHYTLNLPGLIGITVVGALGVMMLALSLSGVIAHPRIFRDAFRLRARNGGGVGLADWHNRLSVWSLPFALAVALTGAMIGLATVTAYAVATANYDGDVAAVYAPIFGGEGEGEGDEAAGPVPDVGSALRYMAAVYPGVTPTYAILHDPMTAGQHIQIVAEHDRRLIFGEYYEFDAAGRSIGSAGLSDGAMGQQMAASAYRLHFGNFGSLPVKFAYFLLGLALTAICATGVYIWLGKRERRGLGQPRLRAMWDGVVIGAPLSLFVTVFARIAIGSEAPFAAIFWLAYAATILTMSFLPRTRMDDFDMLENGGRTRART